jgi:hypothetical protein
VLKRKSVAKELSLVAPGPLAVCASNPRYFCDPNRNVIYLAGDHAWANLVDRGTIQPPPAFDYKSYLYFMKSHGFNWMRLWTKELVNSSEQQDNISPPPYKWMRTGPGKANDGALKFDLSQLDQAYFDRMRSRIIEAGESGIYVSVMLFNGLDWIATNPTDGNPFEGSNNINDINCGGTCPTTASLIPPRAWTYEKDYLQKVIDTVHDLPNVMYEVSNESPAASTAWQENVIAEVNRYEMKQYGVHHPVGFTFQYPDGVDRTLFKSSADWISPLANVSSPSEANGSKVIINDTDHSYGQGQLTSDGPTENIAWAWKNFTNGVGIAFMDPYLVVWAIRNNCGGAPVGGDRGVCSSLDPKFDPIRRAIQDVLVYAKKMDLARMTPQSSLSTSGFCLANSGSEYLVFSKSNSFTLRMVPGTYIFEWFNPWTHSIARSGSVSVGSSRTFTAPFRGQAVLLLHK